MNKLLLIILLILPNLSFANLSDKQLINLYREIKCIVCEAQSIAESNTEHALIIKDFIKHKADKGATSEEIKIFLVEQFGPDILFMPPSEGYYKLLWIFPYVCLGICIIVICYKKLL